MRKTILLFVVCGILSTNTYAVKHSSLKETEITFHNFSGNTFDASAMKMTINNQWLALSALTLISGNWNAPAGSDIVVGGFNLPLNGASVALWYGTVDETNPMAFDMASYVQYGFAGNPFEALAASVSLWAVGDFVHGGPPLTRDNDWSSDGASHWGGTILNLQEISNLKSIEIGPIPFVDRLYIQSNASAHVYNIEMFNVFGNVNYQRSAVKEDEVVINAELLKQGVYFIRIRDEKGNSISRRVVKNE
jgi:hypothetical protein